MFEGGQTDVINIGSGTDISILDLVQIVATVVRPGQEVKVSFNNRMPNGVLSKLMDNSRITGLGWKPKFTLTEGITKTYEWYKNSAYCQPR